MQKILFNGHYGFGNSGDNSFMEVAAWGAKNILGTRNISFHTPLLYYKPILQNEATFYNKSLFRGHQSIQEFFKIKTTDIFISAGGSLFQDILNSNNIRSKSILQKKRKKKLKIGAIGISLGPFKNIQAEKNITEYLKSIDFLTLRDSRSYNFAKTLNLPYEPIYSGDLAALLPQVYKDLKPLTKINSMVINIGVSVCNYEQYQNVYNGKEANREKFYVTLLNKILSIEHVSLLFFIFHNDQVYGDKNLTLKLINKLTPCNDSQIQLIDYEPNIYKLWSKICTCNVMISTRLHASIFSCFANIPFFLIEYHQKCTDFLDDIGQSEHYRIGDAEMDVDCVYKNIEDIILSNHYQIPSKREIMNTNSILNFKIPKNYIA